MTPISSFWDTVLDFWLSPGSWNSFKAVQSLLGDGKWEIHSVYWKQSSPLNLLLLWPFTNSLQEHKYGVHIWSDQNRDSFGPDQDWNYGGWGEGRNKTITPPDLMLNQWHFKGNQGGSCQPVFMSCSEIEAPQWRSLCWKQRCEHFSMSLLLLFWVSLHPISFSALTYFLQQMQFAEAPQPQHTQVPGGHPEPQNGLEPLVGAEGQHCLLQPPCPQGSCAKHLLSVTRSKIGSCDYKNMSV